MDKLIVIGDSGHGKVIKDIAVSAGFTIVAIIDDKYEHDISGDIIVSNTSHLREIMALTGGRVIIAIGNNEIREKIVKEYDLSDDDCATLIASGSWISPSAAIGSGTVVMPGVVINADATIGKQTIINSGAIIEHDAVVGNYAHISPNATLTGGAKVGDATHIGANTVINPRVEVGSHTIIGSGASVIRTIPDNVTAYGVPAKIKGE